jgi:peptidoglycan/LPS O-acetylase OafA/YrhL
MQQIASVQVLRAIAAIAVVACHYGLFYSQSLGNPNAVTMLAFRGAGVGLAIAIALSVALALAVYYAFERPVTRALRNVAAVRAKRKSVEPMVA